MSMRRSTRFRRLIVAFLVVIVLAVVVRFARAAAHDGIARSGNHVSGAVFSIETNFGVA